MKKIFLLLQVFLIILILSLLSCSDSSDGGDNSPEEQEAMDSDASVIFLHHSTGNVIWNGGVAAFIINYNTVNSTSYTITAEAYPNAPYPT